MSMDVTLPDGTVIKGVPDGTTREQLAQKLVAKGFKVPDAWLAKKRFAPGTPEFEAAYQKKQDEMVAGMSTGQRLAAAAGKAVEDTGRGVGELVGLVKPQDVAESRRLDEALMRTRSGKAGNIAGYALEAVPLSYAARGLAPAAGAGLLARVATGGLSGGAQGYAAPYTSTGEHVANTLIGAGTGALLPGAGAMVSNAMRGLASPEARTLLEAGVRLTPGQMLGGMARRAEDAAMSLPVVGSAIRNAQRRAINDFNLASVEKALQPIGVKLGKGVEAGYDAIEQGRKAITSAYDKVLGQMKGRVDSTLTNKIAGTLTSHVNTLPDNLARKLMQTVDEDVLQKLGKGQWVGGKEIKEVISNLGNEVRAAQQSIDPAYRQLGKAFQSIQNDVKAMLKRSNPKEMGEELANVDAAHARMLRVENAAARVGADEGKFSAAQLRSAVRAEDSSYKKRGFSQGNALLQDWADAGKNVLPQKVPDSGTAERLRLLDTAAMLVPGLAAHAVYSAPSRFLIERALAPRPNPVSNYLANLAQQRLGNPANALVGRAFAPQPMPQPSPQVQQQ
jgi:hypothetical protein